MSGSSLVPSCPVVADGLVENPAAQPRRSRSNRWKQIETGRKLLSGGAGSLDDRELLEVLIGSLAPGPVHLKELAQATPSEMVGAFGDEAAARLLCAVELGRRLLTAEETRPRLSSPRAIYEFLAPQLLALRHEEFHVLAFNSRNTLVASKRVAVGTVTSCVVDPREVFAVAISSRATAIVLAHNHPSGEPFPSPQDIALTRQLAAGAELLGIHVLDHLVIGDGRYVAFSERGLLPQPGRTRT